MKLQKVLSSTIRKQHWTIHFEIDQILQPADCDSTMSTHIPTISPIYEGKPNPLYPMYKMIPTKEEWANYFNIWLSNNNAKGENDASKHDKQLYQE